MGCNGAGEPCVSQMENRPRRPLYASANSGNTLMNGTFPLLCGGTEVDWTQQLIMKNPTPHTIFVSVVIVVLSGCSSKEAVAPLAGTEWHSENFDISAALGDGWQEMHVNSPGDTFDRPGDLLQGFLKPSGTCSYIIKVEKDVPLDQLSLEDYLDANRTQYTSHPAYELIDESDVDFHGRRFHRFRLKVEGAKGPAAMYSHIFRDGTNLVSVQWTFPIETDGQISVPDAITQFDERVAINVFGQPNE